jgi:hypothetical protein
VGTRGAPSNIVEKTFDETSRNPKKHIQSFMARFEYRGDTFVFTASGGNDAPMLDTNNQPMTSGSTIDRSFMVPLVNGCSSKSDRGASLLLDAVNTDASPRYSKDAMKPFARLVLHISSY